LGQSSHLCGPHRAVIAIGVVVFATPFLSGATPNGNAANSAYVLGVLVAAAGLLAAFMASPSRSVAWIAAALSVILFFGPWLLACAQNSSATSSGCMLTTASRRRRRKRPGVAPKAPTTCAACTVPHAIATARGLPTCSATTTVAA
jgi:hypothetical protein